VKTGLQPDELCHIRARPVIPGAGRWTRGAGHFLPTSQGPSPETWSGPG
jgi:hypothetical protein